MSFCYSSILSTEIDFRKFARRLKGKTNLEFSKGLIDPPSRLHQPSIRMNFNLRVDFGCLVFLDLHVKVVWYDTYQSYKLMEDLMAA